MLLRSTKQDLKFGFVAVGVLISLHLWSFKMIADSTYKLLEAVFLGGIILALMYYMQVLNRRTYFKVNVVLLLVIPLISSVAALVFHDQSYDLSLLILRTNFIWLLYFVLHAFNIPKQRIINFILFIGFVWAALTIIQQFTYPNYYFFSRRDTDNYSIYRAGVYRFMVYGQHYGTFMLLYFFYKYLTAKKVFDIVFILIGLAGLYYYGTRQFALAAGICLLLTLFIVKGYAKYLGFLIVTLGIWLGYIYREYLFGEYIELTTEQFKYGDNIRQLSANFWFNEYWPNWIAKITGNGTPHGLSAYGKEMEDISNSYRYFRSDVGIIGAYNEFGILYVINVFWFNLKGLRVKLLSRDSKYLPVLFLNALILLTTSEYYSHIIGIPFYCLLFYLFEKSIVPPRQSVEVIKAGTNRQHMIESNT